MDLPPFRDLAEGIALLVAAGAFLAGAALFFWKREWRARLQMTIGIEGLSEN